MSKSEIKPPTNTPNVNATPIDFSQAEKRLWLVKVKNHLLQNQLLNF